MTRGSENTTNSQSNNNDYRSIYYARSYTIMFQVPVVLCAFEYIITFNVATNPRSSLYDNGHFTDKKTGTEV